jgi:positive regulator of sigma E activity
MNKELLPKALIAMSLVLLSLNITKLDFGYLGDASYYSIASNVLVILAMMVLIKNFRRHQRNQE